MFHSYSSMQNYLPIRDIKWDDENLGVLLYESYRGVELSHIAILNYFIYKTDNKSEVPPQILTYISKVLLLGLEGNISTNEVLRGKGNKARKKTRLPTDLFSAVALLKGGIGDLKSFYEKLSEYSLLVGNISPDTIEKEHQKERKRAKRLLETKRLLDEIIEVYIMLNTLKPLAFDGPQHITELESQLTIIYKEPNRLW
jgi:hypothetical protein